MNKKLEMELEFGNCRTKLNNIISYLNYKMEKERDLLIIEILNMAYVLWNNKRNLPILKFYDELRIFFKGIEEYFKSMKTVKGRTYFNVALADEIVILGDFNKQRYFISKFNQDILQSQPLEIAKERFNDSKDNKKSHRLVSSNWIEIKKEKENEKD